MSFFISGREIGPDVKPFIIAEMSGNHNQSLDRALEIVDAAAAAGADAIKLQTYTADTMTLNEQSDQFIIKEKDSPWYGENLYNLYQKAHTPWEWHPKIMERAKHKNILCFSSPFDETAVDYLESLNVPAFKIASFENNHLPLIRKVARTKKPIIISTGLATLGELEQAVETVRTNGGNNLILLKCTSTYPASPINTNLKTISHMRSLFNCEVGLSDHTKGIGAAVASVSLGATVIEKHLTLSRKDGGVDSSFSLEPQELKSLVEETTIAHDALGKVFYGPTEKERQNLIYRRSIYTTRDIREGEEFNDGNIKVIRPGFGASPSLYDSIIGLKANKSYKAGSPLSLKSLL